MTPRQETVRRRSPAAPFERLAGRKPTLRVAVPDKPIVGMAAGV
jgi:hypothetical protein